MARLRRVRGHPLRLLLISVLPAAPQCAAAQLLSGASQPVDWFTGKPRAVVISDIGNEPDDQMSFVRLLLYSNQLDLEAMIAVTSTWQKTAASFSQYPTTVRRPSLPAGESSSQ